MPSCFTLTKKGQKERSKFVDVDREMCKFFEVEVDEKEYLCGWYNFVGQLTAVGRTWDEIRGLLKENLEGGKTCEWSESMLQIVDWLEENYTTDAWYEWK